MSSLRLTIEIGLALFITLTAAGAGSPPPPRGAPAKPRARVLIVQDSKATDLLKPRPEVIQTMVARGLRALTKKTNLQEAWLSLVSTQDVVGLKVFATPGPNSGTRPAVVVAVVQGLIQAGVPPRQIIIWDKESKALTAAGYYELGQRFGVQVRASAEAGWDNDTFYDRALLGNLVWGDHEFGKKGEGVGRKSFVSKVVSQQMTKIINLTPMLSHNQAGVTGHLLSLSLGSIDNTIRFESNPDQLAEVVPEIYALEILGDRVVLNITDALICQYQGEQRSLLHYSAVLNQLRFSKDPVALDVLSLQEIERQRKRAASPAPKLKTELYSNAAVLQLGISNPKQIQLEYVP
jgi:hypothetical protein